MIYSAKLADVRKEQIPYKDESKGTYPAIVLELEYGRKSGKEGTYTIPVSTNLLKKNEKLAEQMRAAKDLIGSYVQIGKNEKGGLVSVGKSEFKKSFGKSAGGGGTTSSYEEGAKRGHAITNAVNIAISQKKVTKENILEMANMILEISQELESGQSTSTGNTSQPVVQTKGASVSESADFNDDLDDFDFD